MHTPRPGASFCTAALGTSRGGKSSEAFVRDSPERPVENFRESVENLLNEGGAEGGQKPDFQSGSGVVFRDAPYLGSRHAASRPAVRRNPKRSLPGDRGAQSTQKDALRGTRPTNLRNPRVRGKVPRTVPIVEDVDCIFDRFVHVMPKMGCFSFVIEYNVRRLFEEVCSNHWVWRETARKKETS